MKIKRIILGLCCLLNWDFLFAQDLQNTKKNSEQTAKIARLDSLHALYNYSDFKYNASNLTTISRFQGHSNLYLLGGNSVSINRNIIAGLFIYKMDSYLNFTQSPLAFTTESIRNNSFFGHVLKQIKPSVFIDLIGGYGQNHLNFKTLATEDIQPKQLGYAKSRGNSWFIGLRAFYSHSWNDFSLISSIGALHTEVSQDAFNFFLVSTPNNPLPALSSKASFLLENTELTYKHNSTFQPFVNAGLIQVLQNPDNRANLAALSVASLPNSTINLNKNGFSVGAGFSLKYRQLLLRLEQQYYQRGTIYHSNQSIVSIRSLIG